VTAYITITRDSSLRSMGVLYDVKIDGAVVPELRALDVATPDARRLLAGELEEVGPHEVVMWKPRWRLSTAPACTTTSAGSG